LFCDPIELSFLGAGYPLFFNYLKFCIKVLLISFLVSGLFNLYTNSKGGDCLTVQAIVHNYLPNVAKPTAAQIAAVLAKQNLCELNWMSKFSLANKHTANAEQVLQESLNLLTIVATIFFLQYFR